MNIDKKRKEIIFILMLGFFCGILYTNLIARKYPTITNIFHETYLSKYLYMQNVSKEYLNHLIQCRIFPFVVFTLLVTTKYKKISAILLVLWTGFSGGALAVTAVLAIGSTGMFVCIFALLPHSIFYGSSYFVEIWYCLNNSQTVWNHTKTVFVIIMQLIGIWMEAFWNPLLMKMIMQWLL